MRDMTAKLQDGYKNNAMHVNPKHKWCMKKILVKNIETENFSVAIDRSRIDRTLIEAGRLKPKILIAISIDRKTSSIDRKSGKNRFLKNIAF